jgi:hypothetical protein
MLALGYENKRSSRKKRKNVNYMEDIVTVTRVEVRKRTKKTE